MKPIDKNTLVHLMPKVFAKRNGQTIKPEECVTLQDIVNSYVTGELDNVNYTKAIKKIRALKGTKQYDKLKTTLPAYRIGYGPSNKVNPLVPIDSGGR